MSESAIPVTVIGGYLGAGKTTAVNHLLRHADGRRLAVLVNDFGSVPIDADLIVSTDGNVVSIAGGCVCCSYGGELAAALDDLGRRCPRPDHVVVEASGVALPGAVGAAVTLVAGFRLDGIVSLADAETIARRGQDRFLADTVARQLHDAQIIILNKCDLAGPGLRESARAYIAGVAGEARVVETEQGAISPEVVFEPSLESAPRSTLAVPQHTGHTGGYVSDWIAIPRGVDVGRVAATLGASRLGLLRAKGFVRDMAGGLHLVQVVGRRHSATLVAGFGVKETGVVVIGLAEECDLARVVDAITEASG